MSDSATIIHPEKAEQWQALLDTCQRYDDAIQTLFGLRNDDFFSRVMPPQILSNPVDQSAYSKEAITWLDEWYRDGKRINTIRDVANSALEGKRSCVQSGIANLLKLPNLFDENGEKPAHTEGPKACQYADSKSGLQLRLYDFLATDIANAKAPEGVTPREFEDNKEIAIASVNTLRECHALLFEQACQLAPSSGRAR